MTGHRDELLRRPEIVGVVGLASPREGDAGRVMEVVVPDGVQAISGFARRPQQCDVLGFVLGDDPRVPRRGGGADVIAHVGQDVTRRPIANRLRGIKAQAIQMEFADPVAGVGSNELPAPARTLAHRN